MTATKPIVEHVQPDGSVKQVVKIREPEKYVPNFGGKVSLALLSKTDKPLIEAGLPVLLSFNDFVDDYIRMFNIIHKTNIVITKQLRAVLRYDENRERTQPKTAVTDTTTQLNDWINNSFESGQSEAEIIATLKQSGYNNSVLAKTGLFKSLRVETVTPPPPPPAFKFD